MEFGIRHYVDNDATVQHRTAVKRLGATRLVVTLRESLLGHKAQLGNYALMHPRTASRKEESNA